MGKSVKSAAGRGTLYAAVVEATGTAPSKVVADAIAEIEALDVDHDDGPGRARAYIYVRDVASTLEQAATRLDEQDDEDFRAIGAALGSTVATLRANNVLSEENARNELAIALEKIAVVIPASAEEIAEWLANGVNAGCKFIRSDLKSIIGVARQERTIKEVRTGVSAVVRGALNATLMEKFSGAELDAVIGLKEGAPIEWPDKNKDEKTPNHRSLKNVAAFLEHYKITVWHDDFSMENKIAGLKGYPDGARMDDGVLQELCGLMIDAGCRTTLATFSEMISMLARRKKKHPVREYVSDAQAKWDNKKRIDTLFIDYLGVEDTKLHRAFGRAFMISAVRRVRQPGCDFAGVPILEGYTGGEGKSRFARLLFTDKWFTDTVRFGDDSKMTIEQASGAWCCEVAELEGMTDKREFATIKAAVSRTTDKARLAYGRSTSVVQRQFVMIGTTNEPAYLKDRGGLRRFWPMRVNPDVLPKMEKQLLRLRDQLWAEAAVAEAAGEAHTLPRDLWAEAAEAQSQRVIVDPNEEWLHTLLSTAPSDGILANEEVRKACQAETMSYDQIARSGALTRVAAKLGFEERMRRHPITGAVVRVKVKGRIADPAVWLEYDSNLKKIVRSNKLTRAGSLSDDREAIAVRPVPPDVKVVQLSRPKRTKAKAGGSSPTRH